MLQCKICIFVTSISRGFTNSQPVKIHTIRTPFKIRCIVSFVKQFSTNLLVYLFAWGERHSLTVGGGV